MDVTFMREATQSMNEEVSHPWRNYSVVNNYLNCLNEWWILECKVHPPTRSHRWWDPEIHYRDLSRGLEVHQRGLDWGPICDKDPQIPNPDLSHGFGIHEQGLDWGPLANEIPKYTTGTRRVDWESTNEVSIEVPSVMGSRDITQPGPENRDPSRGESTNEVSIEFPKCDEIPWYTIGTCHVDWDLKMRNGFGQGSGHRGGLSPARELRFSSNCERIPVVLSITRYFDDFLVNQLENLTRFGEHLVRFGWELCTGGVFFVSRSCCCCCGTHHPQ